MLANNEVGTIEPVADLAAILREYAARQRHRVMLHTDAVQAPGWLPVDVQALGIDALSLSSHKFGGPKGSGVLFLRRATPFHALLLGGGQEMQKRAGTENVAGIVGTAKALELACSDIPARAARVRALRERLREGVLAAVPDAETNGCQENCLPNNLNISFEGIEGDDLVARLDAPRDRGEHGQRLLERHVGALARVAGDGRAHPAGGRERALQPGRRHNGSRHRCCARGAPQRGRAGAALGSGCSLGGC